MKQNLLFVLLILTTLYRAFGQREEFRWSTNAKESSFSKRVTRTRRASNVVAVHQFTANQREVAVRTHNEARRTVVPSSSDMTEMSWNDELEALALGYSQECVFEHNPTRQHSRFTSVGENIYISYGIDFDYNFVENAILAWDGEKVFYDYARSSCAQGEICGHYTQVVWASSFAIGCAAATCDSVNVNGNLWRDATILVCNYGPAGNIQGRFPYKAGIEPCSECVNKDDVCEQSLCSNPDRLVANPQASWLPWEQWGECSQSCGGVGRRYRSRQCSTYVLSDCEGYSRQYDPYCASKACEAAPTQAPQSTTKKSEATENCDSWTKWSSCSKTCGIGRKERSHVCVRDYGTTVETTKYTQMQSCRIKPC